ncbi:hypothetical protein RO3G_09980 [Rhizopus delemar RA 99-880]|uniref:SMC hinge domain-containing protein n=1 Tax=Rhizopus delemar (strain RA 99-880 / ATCC MYA-4621 / FGSC 9543 / NRRL 43880) TaxID=246409 RepID=I1C9Z0_RHIO9|nr:hypothetical protein RO3G_09980 [Rhizopus delemar RA 99-880]|eukprot:EIE85270.1 hypothetical protein RO3G_09980 [Rhizopus delemar RA 99-880]
MVLNNFKSYAVVGPNGSGKSNVIDALLFVFGYRANKMRQGKLSELIHNSAKHPNCQACTVEIHFHEIIDGEGINDYQIVPGSQLVVARQASRNNASKYFINDKASNFTEVTSLLKARGIDLDHKRFLILQGEVESIALMKPKAKDNNDDGLLEYLEDIIGTSKYKAPIEEASVRLEALNEVRGEKVGRVKYVSREMEGMEEKKAEAENYLENENELAQRKNELYQIYLYETRQNVDVATRAIEELNTKMSEEVKKCEAIEQEKLALNDTYQQTVDAYNEIEKESEKIAKRQAKLEREDVQLREKKEHMVNKQEKGKATLESDREARLAAQEAIKKNTEELNDRKEEVTELEKQLKIEETKLEEISKELKGKTDSYLAQIEQHQKELAPWTEKINEKQKTIDVKRSEIEILTEQIMSELAKTESDTRAKLNIARQKADEARLSLQHSQNRGKVLSSILRMRDSGRIDGIYDRLGSLGVIDDKYDVAISTACPALDNIVVETVEAAQACIQYLRKNNLGRAVFTVLNQLRHQRTDKIKTPEHVPRLFDLVEPKDKKFIPAFYSVLQDTLVAEDLKQANRIAYGEKRWRVVTVDGKLIEKSGAMTGGGNKQLRGAMSSTFREEGASAETVAALESERDGLEKKYKDVSEEKRATELGLKRKKDHLPRLEVSFEKLQMDLRSLETQLEEENGRIEELKKQVEPRPSDLKRQAEIEEEIEQIVIEIGELKEKTAVIEKTIASLHEQIMDAGGMELRQQKTCVNNIRKRIDQLNDRITKNMVAKSKAEKDVTKLEASIRKFERDTEMFETNLKELEKEANELAQDMAAVTEKVEQTKKLMEEKKVEMEEFKQQIDEKTESINKLRQAEVNIKNELEDYKRTLIDNEKKAAYWEEQRSKLFLQQITGEETDEQLQLHILEGEALQELAKSKQSIKMIIAEIEAFVQSAKPNLSVLDEYRRRLAEYNERKKDLDAVTAERDTIKNEVDTLRKARLDEFMQGFNIISQKLKEMYQMITMGGNAELELVDSLDPFSEGIVFSVMPPKKSWKNISNLSGGEKVS